MKTLNHFIYQSILLISLLKAFPFKSFIKKYDKGSKNVIWVHPNFPLGSFKYFGSAAIFQDLALINSLSIQLNDFKIFFGPKIGVLHNKNLFYSFTDKFNSFKFDSNSRFLYGFIKNLEKQNCKFFPSLEELRFWEDKEYMYKKFDELKIPIPKTSFFALGFLPIAVTNAAKIFPIPTPTPANAITARPAPISFAASISILFSFR